MKTYNSTQLWKRYYPLYLYIILMIFGLLILPLFNLWDLGYNLIELTLLLVIFWELIWIFLNFKNKFIIFQSILRIFTSISYIVLSYLLISSKFGNSLIFGSRYNRFDPVSSFLSVNISLVFVFLIVFFNEFNGKHLVDQCNGLVSWKKMNNSL